jgi:hypothetical protein
MAKSFSVEVSLREPSKQAQARAVSALTSAARAVGLRLTKRRPGELRYRPRVQFPFLLMLWHNLNGERMSVRFEGTADGGTLVQISGAVSRTNHALASDPEHWSEALGVSGAPAR